MNDHSHSEPDQLEDCKHFHNTIGLASVINVFDSQLWWIAQYS
jgi:hypothetical protein